MKKYVTVILDDNIKKPLDYLIPKTLIDKIVPGMRVEVPIKNSKRKATVLKIKYETDIKNVKEINKIISQKKISKDLFSLSLWMSKYYICSLSKIFKSIFPTSIRKEIKPKFKIFLTLNKSKKESLKLSSSLISKNPIQYEILNLFLKTKKGFFLNELLKLTNLSRSPINSLIKKKILKAKKVNYNEDLLILNSKYFPTKPKILTKEQENAFKKIKKNIEEEIFEIHLLFGITGSGKTEIYLQAIQKVLDIGKTVIMLIPEISLTPQTIERLKSRFSEKIAIMHSKRSQGERYDAWNNIINKKIKIVVGARSAIFSPIKNLGLIIVDEEHDLSYKQSEDTPSYNGRNVAIMRAKFANCPIILGSATPSLESFYNAQKKNYILSLLSERPNKAKLPKVEIVDMRKECKTQKGFTHFSQKLLDSVKERIKKGEQTILFLNRRGYHTFIFCPKCSNSLKCPHCDISLIFHKKENYLSCHCCGYKTKPKKFCDICKKEHYKYKGFGTEHVEISLKNIFPSIRTIRIDKDTTSKKNSHEVLFKEFNTAKADVLIGTQMIVKGLHFPSVTLVGILNTDGALNIPNFRSSEIVFQLITQVAGRAGREDFEGEVIIQTFMPDNEIIKLASKQDYLNFYKYEIQNRKLFSYPPFTKMVKIIFSSKEEIFAKKTSEIFRKELIKKLPSNIKIYPSVPSYKNKLKDKYIFYFIIIGKNILPISEAIFSLKNTFVLPKSLHMFIDVNPIL